MEGYAHLMPEAFRVWDSLWRATGTPHYEPCGAVYFLRGDECLQDGGWYEGTSRSLDAMGIGYRGIPLDDVERRFPMVRTEGLQRVVSTDGAGMLFPIRILTDLVVLLGRLGVALRAGAQVGDVDLEHGRVVADGATHEGDIVVVAAGAWVDRLVPGLRGVAVPSRQAVLYLSPPADMAAAWAAAPVMLDVQPEIGVYTLPPRCGTRLKIGDHAFSRSGDPDDDRIANADDLARLWPAARAAYRGLERYSVLEPKACFYTVMADEEFLVRPAGAAGWLISACSGHGFKLGPLMGELVGRAVAGEMAAAEVADLAAGRVLNPSWRETADAQRPVEMERLLHAVP